MIYERRGLYFVDLYRPATHTVASIFTIIDDTEGGPRPYDDEDNESYEGHDK